jgi:flagellar basal body P-ring formation protein FlgA
MKRVFRLFFLFVFAGLAGLRSAPEPEAVVKVGYDAERFRGEICRLLAAHFNLDGELEVEFIRPWIPPVRTAGVWQVVVSEFPAVATSTMVVRCRLIADGARVAEPDVMMRAMLWRDVWFARQPLSAGSVFNPSALDTQRIDCLRVHDALPASAGDRSFIFGRDIQADRMLTWHDLARRPLVHKGEVVDAIAREGWLTVTMKAMALENGASGDFITVRNLESHKEISAQVVEENQVEVRF